MRRGRMQGISIIYLLLVAILSLVSAIYLPASSTTIDCSATDDVLISGSLDLTGSKKTEGTSMLYGIRTFQQWLNNDHQGINVGGVPRCLSLNISDDKSSSAKAAMYAREAVADADFVFAPYSSS